LIDARQIVEQRVNFVDSPTKIAEIVVHRPRQVGAAHMVHGSVTQRVKAGGGDIGHLWFSS
jgi:hypothetical protein